MYTILHYATHNLIPIYLNRKSEKNSFPTQPKSKTKPNQIEGKVPGTYLPGYTYTKQYIVYIPCIHVYFSFLPTVSIDNIPKNKVESGQEKGREVY